MSTLSGVPTNRRERSDRRHRPTRFHDFLSGPTRRHRGRRQGDGPNSYVDVYRRGDVLLLLGILVLNIFDALFTLLWLQQGGGEANPLMDFLIRSGNGVFIAQKCFVVGIWLVVLTVHKNFRFARVGMWTLFALYALLLLYHGYLHWGGVSPVLQG